MIHFARYSYGTKLSIIICIFFTLTSCGDGSSSQPSLAAAPSDGLETENSPNSNSPSGTIISGDTYSVTVDNAQSLPICDAAGEGRLAYVRSQANFQTCQSGYWQIVTISASGSTPATKSMKPTILNSEAEPVSSNCQFGGRKINSGQDDDGDGLLSPNEIKSSLFICKDAPAVKIVSIWTYHDANIEASDPDVSLSSLFITTKVGDIQLSLFSDGSAFLSLGGVIQSYDTALNKFFAPFSESFYIPKTSATFTIQKKILSFGYLLQHRINLESTPPQIAVGVQNDTSIYYKDFPLTRNQ